MSFAIRTWRRDGQTNRMSLEAASENLALHCQEYKEPAQSATEHGVRAHQMCQRLLTGEVLETKNAFFRHLGAIVTTMAVAMSMLFACNTAHGQWVTATQPVPEYYWLTTKIQDQIALMHNGRQIGILELSTMAYTPLTDGSWGDPCEAPILPPQQYMPRYEQLGKLREHWRDRGVIRPNGTEEIPEIPNSGLHLRGTPKLPIRIDSPRVDPSVVPAFDTMASITFVAKDSIVAANAAKSFNTMPEFAAWRKKYVRVKDYSYTDFQHTGKAFKLDQDKQFAQTGFVAIVQDAPDDNDKAVVHSIYEFDSPAQFLSALRDADPLYDPNPSPPNNVVGEWTPAEIGVGSLIIAGIGSMSLASWWAMKRTNSQKAKV